jgi:hypothetical protein
VSAPSFFDVFIDLVAPTAAWQPVAPDPRTNAVEAVELVFSEPINEGTFTLADLMLQRDDGPNLLTPGVSLQKVSGSTYRLSGLSGLTAQLGTYRLSLALDQVQDRAGNAGAGLALEVWVFRPANFAPVLPPIADATVAPGALLMFANVATDADFPAQQLTYSLGAGAPWNATINPTTGVFSWRPTPAQAHATYHLTVTVTDNGTPVQSASQTFTVVVEDYAVFGLGTDTVWAGTRARVTVDIAASSPLTELRFIVDAPANRVSNFRFEEVTPEVATVSVEPVAEGLRFTLMAQPGLSLPTDWPLAFLACDAAAGQPSAFVTLRIVSFEAIADGFSLTNKRAQNGRVAVVGAEPLLEAQLVRGQRRLVLYAPAGSRNQLQYTSSLRAPVAWSPWQTVTSFALQQVIDSGFPSGQPLFLRAVRVAP